MLQVANLFRVYTYQNRTLRWVVKWYFKHQQKNENDSKKLFAGPWSCMQPVTNSSRSMVPLRSESNKMHNVLMRREFPMMRVSSRRMFELTTENWHGNPKNDGRVDVCRCFSFFKGGILRLHVGFRGCKQKSNINRSWNWKMWHITYCWLWSKKHMKTTML